MTETYLVASANRHTLSVYHTDAECRNLGENRREVDADHVTRRGLTECARCSGTADTSREDMRTGLRQRIEAGEVDV